MAGTCAQRVAGLGALRATWASERSVFSLVHPLLTDPSSSRQLSSIDPINWFTMAGAVFTLVNAALSASLLALPFAFRKGGAFLSSLSFCSAKTR